MLLLSPLTGTQLSPEAPQGLAPFSGHTPGNRHDRQDKASEGLRTCVCLLTRCVCSLALPPLPCPPLSPPLLPLLALPSSPTVEKVVRWA
ncbi:unnamed protein product [Schistocephalus solidus]|uniref:Secreted protein n=1 Tax=Schistocephalus solidus TaxID=70667 RepID=A0A183T4H8_SCHSO|nr:unnamed protein product [Schistocephalus solidus]